jgi:hypothetical protein
MRRLSRVETFDGENNPIPPYAILLHTWGEEEMQFQDLQEPRGLKKLRNDRTFSRLGIVSADKEGRS